jgi:NAD(P)H-dependent FMN reductase
MNSVLVFAGSARRDSLNKKLARLAAEAIGTAGGSASFIDLDDFVMPLYHGDLEAREGVPARTRELAELIRVHDALLIASPENNASVSSLLKNTLDWLSRIKEFDPLAGKTAALMAASPGAFGGVRGLYHLRAILNTLGVEVLAQQFLLPRAHQAFDTQGKLADAKQAEQLAALAQRLLQLVATPR